MKKDVRMHVKKIENGITVNYDKNSFIRECTLYQKDGNKLWEKYKDLIFKKPIEKRYEIFTHNNSIYIFYNGFTEDELKNIIFNVINGDIYYLMHKNIICAEIKLENYIIKDIKIINKDHIPCIFFNSSASTKDNLIEWLKNRSIPKNRVYYDRIIKNLHNINPIKWLILAKGLRVTDCYWIKRKNSSDTWENVNFFNNSTNDILDKLYIESDIINQNYIVDENTALNPNNTSEGSLPKVWKKQNNKWRLFKDNIYYNEKDNEVLWSKILQELNIPHITYTKEKLDNKTLCVSDNYCNENKEFISAYNLRYLYKKNHSKSDIENYISYCESKGLKGIRKFIGDQLIIDYILANADRHWNNFGVLRNPDTLELIEIMPIYDNGNSLWYKTDLSDLFEDPNLNFTDFIKDKTTKDCLKYVSDWSLLDNEKLYNIPELLYKYRLEIQPLYDKNRLQREVDAVTNHINILKQLKLKLRKD